MVKAKIVMQNGTNITIEGTPDEVQKLIKLYDNTNVKKEDVSHNKSRSTKKDSQIVTTEENLTKIVNTIKDCDEADVIEKNVIDRISQVNRVLLPLYIVHEYLQNSISLQSGEVGKITKDLGIPLSQPNVSRVLSGVASRYVMGNRAKKKGQAVKYQLNRRGLKYFQEVLKGNKND